MRFPPLRQLALWLFVVGSLGLAAELILTEHTDSIEQWIPLVMLALGVIGAFVVARWHRPALLKTFWALMGLFVGGGALGLYYHLTGNIEFALERDPTLTGLALVWKALRGATPTLAPGALAQLGLLGLLATLPERLTERARSSEGNR